MTPNTPRYGSPREPLFRNHGTKSFILVYNLYWLENVLILTPNDPKNPPSWGHPDFSLFLAEVSGQDLSNELSSVNFGRLSASERHLHWKKHVTKNSQLLPDFKPHPKAKPNPKPNPKSNPDHNPKPLLSLNLRLNLSQNLP